MGNACVSDAASSDCTYDHPKRHLPVDGQCVESSDADGAVLSPTSLLLPTSLRPSTQQSTPLTAREATGDAFVDQQQGAPPRPLVAIVTVACTSAVSSPVGGAPPSDDQERQCSTYNIRSGNDSSIASHERTDCLNVNPTMAAVASTTSTTPSHTIQAPQAASNAQRRRRQRSRSQEFSKRTAHSSTAHQRPVPTTPHQQPLHGQGFKSVLVRAEGGHGSTGSKLLEPGDDLSDLPELMLMSATSVVGATATNSTTTLAHRGGHSSGGEKESSGTTGGVERAMIVHAHHRHDFLTAHNGGHHQARHGGSAVVHPLVAPPAETFCPIGLPTPGSSAMSLTGVAGVVMFSADAFGGM